MIEILTVTISLGEKLFTSILVLSYIACARCNPKKLAPLL
jgi:hypothetical protein